MKQVVIGIFAGLAEIVYVSKNVEVTIVNVDISTAKGKNGWRKLDYWIKRAKEDERKHNIQGKKKRK